MIDKILLVDDDPNILEGYKRNLRKKYEIETASDGLQGLKVAEEKGPFAVIVSDLRMPGMDGIEFLSKARRIVPDTVRMMLTGNADLNASIEAVNEGNVFRFLTKPCSVEKMSAFLDAGIDQYRLVKAEKDLLEGTLRGSVKVLIDILSMASPAAFGRATRLQRVMAGIAEELDIEHKWEFELAGMLSQTGCVTLPTQVISKIYSGAPLNAVEARMFESHPRTGHDLITNIPRLRNVARIILYQEKHYNGEGFPQDSVKGEYLPLGARALNIAIAYDTLNKTGKTLGDVLQQIEQSSHLYDPKLLEVLKKFAATEKQYTIKTISVADLSSEMVIAKDMKTSSGLLLIAKGQSVTPALKERLSNFTKTQEITGSVEVLVPDTGHTFVAD